MDNINIYVCVYIYIYIYIYICAVRLLVCIISTKCTVRS